MRPEDFREIVTRARLAPSIHNSQPARWRLRGDAILIGCDPAVTLPASDPEGVGIGMSCGAAAEATLLALSAGRHGSVITDLWAKNDRETLPGYRLAARITLEGETVPDPLSGLIEARFLHRGIFDAKVADLFGWTRRDTLLVTDAPRKDWLAELYDAAALRQLRRIPVRRELLSWMRLTSRHPRARYDGLNRKMLHMSPRAAFEARAVLGPLWRPADLMGITDRLPGEAAQTRSASVIALFHRAKGETPVTSGRAYLRLLLEAVKLGLAAWPMGALVQDDAARAEICERTGLGEDRRLLQVVRLGPANATPPPRVRRPLDELII